MTDGLEALKETIRKILLEHGVRRASLFGSFARGQTGEDSDIDVLVELDEHASLFDLVELKLELEDSTGRRVDLVEFSMIKPAIRDGILKEQVALI